MPALVTPFTRSGELDLDAHRHNLSTLWERGVRGFLVGGSTGEGPYLEPGERRDLVSSARRHLGGRVFLLAGVASETVRGAREQVREAAEGGADAVLVLTPTTLTRGLGPEVVSGFYRDLAEGAPLPILVYSVPAYTAYHLPHPVAGSLLEHPGIVGMKDSGGHPVEISRLAERVGGDVFLFVGSSAAVALSVLGGAYGAITASANYLPELAGEVVRTARRSAAACRAPQERLRSLAGLVEAHRIPGVKEAARAAGLRPGHPRAPLRRLTGRVAGEIRTAVVEARRR